MGFSLGITSITIIESPSWYGITSCRKKAIFRQSHLPVAGALIMPMAPRCAVLGGRVL
ncbi:MAG: hypothetical protein WC975_00660 [Phycisphaerae bacterium]